MSESTRNLLILLAVGVAAYFLVIKGRKPGTIQPSYAPTAIGGGGVATAATPAAQPQPDPWSGANVGALIGGIGSGLGGVLTGISNVIGASTSSDDS